MTREQVDTLKANVNKLVKITATDGQVLVVKLIAVGEEEEDIIYDLVRTNRPDKYERLDVQPAYSLPFRAIERVEPCETPDLSAG